MIIIGFGMFVGLVLVPNLIQEAQVLSQALPDYLNSLIALSEQLHSRARFVPDLSQGLEQLRGVINRVLSIFPVFLTSAFNLTIEVIAVLILSLYMAYDPNSLVQGILRLVPRTQHQRFRRMLYASKIRLQGWIFGTGLAMAIVGVSAAIGLWFLKVPLPLTFGFLAGLLEIIPYFGSIVGALLPAIVALTISPPKALLVLVLFFVINQVDAHLVQPQVIARRVHLHPVMVILAFLVLGELLGFVGVLLAVPAAAIVVTLVDEFSSEPPAANRV